MKVGEETSVHMADNESTNSLLDNGTGFQDPSIHRARENEDFGQLDTNELDSVDDNQRHSGVKGTALNIFNTTVGTGTLAMPGLISSTGIIFGILGIALSALFGVVTGDLILRSKNMAKKSSFMGISQYCYKRKGYWMVIGCQILANLSCALGYLIICGVVGQTLYTTYTGNCERSSTGVITGSSIFCHSWFYAIGGGILILPFSYAKSMAIFESLSFVKAIALFLFMVITVGYFFKSLFAGDISGDTSLLPNVSGLTQAIGSINIATNSCSYQYNMIPIYKSLKPRTDKNMNKSILISSLMTISLFLSVGLSGYLTFGPQKKTLLSIFTQDNLGLFLFTTLQVCFAVACILSFSINFFEARNAMLETCLNIKYRNDENVPAEKKKLNPILKFSIVFIMHFIVVGISALAPNLDLVIQITGATSLNAFVYLFPGGFYLTLSGSKGERTGWAKFFLIFGFVMMFFGLWSSFASIADGSG
jgi:amino acid permease